MSMQNIHETSQVLHEYGIPFYVDACRYAEYAYFIKLREEPYRERSVREIARATFAEADGCLMSSKKDGLVNIGGFIALKESRWVDHSILGIGEKWPIFSFSARKPVVP